MQPDDSHDSEISLDVCRRPAKLDASRVHFTEDWDVTGFCLLLSMSKAQSSCHRRTHNAASTWVSPSAAGPPVSAADVETLYLGFPHSPEAFIQKAVLAGHPMTVWAPCLRAKGGLSPLQAPLKTP